MNTNYIVEALSCFLVIFKKKRPVLDPGKGVCANPRRGDATLGVGGPRPPMGDNEHQLSLDRGGEKT